VRSDPPQRKLFPVSSFGIFEEFPYFDPSAQVTFHIRHLHEKERLSKRLLQKGKGAFRLIPWRRLLTLGMLMGKPLYNLGKKMHERHERELHMKRALAMGAACVVVLTIVLMTFSMLLKISGFSMGSLLRAHTLRDTHERDRDIVRHTLRHTHTLRDIYIQRDTHTH